jgi:hypothetical protein
VKEAMRKDPDRESYDQNSMDAVLSRVLEKQDMIMEELEQLKKAVADLDRFRYLLLGAAALVGGLGAKVLHLIKGDS